MNQGQQIKKLGKGGKKTPTKRLHHSLLCAGVCLCSRSVSVLDVYVKVKGKQGIFHSQSACLETAWSVCVCPGRGLIDATLT